jgi:lysozyme
MISGSDVSVFQGAFQWTDEAFGFAKATEGAFLQDPMFAHNFSAMKAKGIRRGAYHFGHPSTSAAAQAAFFVGFVKAQGLGQWDALALDLEVADGLPASEVAEWAVSFCNAVEKATGKNVWVYTNHAFISGGYCDGLYKHPLWIADPSTPAGHPGSVAPWAIWVAHQYAWGATGSGQPDRDVLNGDTAVWDQLVNLTTPAKYKTVTSAWTCEGVDSLTGLCAAAFNGTAAPGLGASTVLRMTLDNSRDQLFAADLAAYVSAGDLAKTPVPKGVVLFYPKRVKV